MSDTYHVIKHHSTMSGSGSSRSLSPRAGTRFPLATYAWKLKREPNLLTPAWNKRFYVVEERPSKEGVVWFLAYYPTDKAAANVASAGDAVPLHEIIKVTPLADCRELLNRHTARVSPLPDRVKCELLAHADLTIEVDTPRRSWFLRMPCRHDMMSFAAALQRLAALPLTTEPPADDGPPHALLPSVVRSRVVGGTLPPSLRSEVDALATAAASLAASVAGGGVSTKRLIGLAASSSSSTLLAAAHGGGGSSGSGGSSVISSYGGGGSSSMGAATATPERHLPLSRAGDREEELDVTSSSFSTTPLGPPPPLPTVAASSRSLLALHHYAPPVASNLSSRLAIAAAATSAAALSGGSSTGHLESHSQGVAAPPVVATERKPVPLSAPPASTSPRSREVLVLEGDDAVHPSNGGGGAAGMAPPPSTSSSASARALALQAPAFSGSARRVMALPALADLDAAVAASIASPLGGGGDAASVASSGSRSSGSGSGSASVSTFTAHQQRRGQLGAMPHSSHTMVEGGEDEGSGVVLMPAPAPWAVSSSSTPINGSGSGSSSNMLHRVAFASDTARSKQLTIESAMMANVGHGSGGRGGETVITVLAAAPPPTSPSSSSHGYAVPPLARGSSGRGSLRASSIPSKRGKEEEEGGGASQTLVGSLSEGGPLGGGEGSVLTRRGGGEGGRESEGRFDGFGYSAG